jgi:polyisoprenoid-binding protein YceI
MKRFLLAAAAALSVTAVAPLAMAQAYTPSTVPAGVYKLDKRHAHLGVTARHMGASTYHFRFRTYDAEVTLDPKNPAASKVSFTVDPASVDTLLPDFNTEIGTQFLNAPEFKEARFVSTRVQPTGADKARVTGDLTIRGVTKPATFEVTFTGGQLNTRSGKPLIGLNAVGTIKRSDYGVAPKLPAVAFGDEVTLTFDGEFSPAS